MGNRGEKHHAAKGRRVNKNMHLETYKRSVIKAFHAIAPKTATNFMSVRARRQSQRLVKEWGLFEINRKLICEVGDKVLAGPFKGMELTRKTWEEHVGPFLLGTYEAELHAWIADICRHSFDCIIDVGAKFGYYAIGMALKYPDIRVIAFDTDRWARRAVTEMAIANHTKNVLIQGHCSPAWLQAHLTPNALIISDCEGYERELFCSHVVENLASATMIIELHEELSPGVSQAVRSRFSATHSISEVTSRTDAHVPQVYGTSLSDDEVRRAAAEIRPAQTWVLLQPKGV